MSELERCPWCNSNVRFEVGSPNINGCCATFYLSVRCPKCGASNGKYGHITIGVNDEGKIFTAVDDRESLVKDWNTRRGNT